LCAPLWDLPWKWSFLYALPETIEVGLSWFLFVKVMHKRIWLPDLVNTIQFLVFGSLLPAALANVYLVAQLFLLGDIARSTLWDNWIVLFSADIATHFVLAVPALILFTKSMAKKGWAKTDDAITRLPLLPDGRSSKADLTFICLVFISVFIMIWQVSIRDYWIVYGLLTIILAIRYGVNVAVITSSWIGTLAFLLPPIIKNQLGLPTVAYSDIFIVNLQILFLCAISLLIGRAISDLLIEIGERKQAEAALRESEKRFRWLFTTSPDSILLIDPHNPDILWPIVDCNEVACEMNGYTREELVGHSIEILSVAQGTQAERTAYLERLRREGVIHFETFHRHKDGHIFPIDVSASLFTFEGHELALGIDRDITERAQSERALRESEEKYRTLFETANDPIILFDKTTTKILNANPMACTLYGYSLDELLQLKVTDISADAQATENAIRSGATRVPLRYHKKKDGTTFPVEITAAAFPFADGIIQVGFVRDITERKQAEHEREKYVEELNQRNAELLQFTYTVSHDLRNPLVTIKGFLGMLDKDLKADRQDRVQSDFQRIANATDKMDELLSALLKLSRIGRFINPPEEVKLDTLVPDAIESLNARIHAKNITINFSTGLPVVYGDRIRLREVFENLIDNAAKYMGSQPNPMIEIGVKNQMEEPVIFVKDNGIGIEPRYQTKIFGLFEKLNPNIEGTGIGLALVKRIIETHGGRVWVESEGSGKGSTFYFTIPDARKTN